MPFGGLTGCPYPLSSFQGHPRPVFLRTFVLSDTAHLGFFISSQDEDMKRKFQNLLFEENKSTTVPQVPAQVFRMMVIKCSSLSFKELTSKGEELERSP